MDNKPLITYAGDITVFESVVPSLQKGIGVEAVEWKRAYGRTTKHVYLNPKYIPFDPPDPLQGTETSGNNSVLTTLLDQPMLHTFWTDCSDVEVYRATTKDLIQSWLNSVKSCVVKEWVIVLVEPSDNKKTNKLLPRSSVLDKIKNDFAQKQTERCVCLSDPQKIDSKTAESLNSVLHRIRQLLLSSYSKMLTKFEENMRGQREKRNDGGWNFCHYFLLQEELAFVLEMLQVYDEALVQYDELDALFTQFVLNSHFTDTPKWLLSFQRYGDRWPALNLSSSNLKVLPQIRETIRSSTISLLNFRNYLFSRQAILLIQQDLFQELAQRSLSFLHNCINELSILDVTFTEEGAMNCWAFVSCLEILRAVSNYSQQTIEKNEINCNVEKGLEQDGIAKQKAKQLHVHLPHGSGLDFSVHTASLWDYARGKLYELGRICGLLPQFQLKGDHLHKVISLAAGLSPFDESTNTNGSNHGSQKEELTVSLSVFVEGETPVQKLKDALSSKDKFQQNYLELCELAMGTYKHIGRLRSARKVGLSLATYYMEAQEYGKAAVFLTEAYNTFKEDRWPILATDVLLKLAHCYQIMNDGDRYIRTCAHIACLKAVDDSRRAYYFDEMMNWLTKIERHDRFVISHTEETFHINSLNIETTGKICGTHCEVIVHIDVTSNFPRPILSNIMQMAIMPCDHVPKEISFTTSDKGKFQSKSSAKRGQRRDSADSNSPEVNAADAGKEGLTRKESITLSWTCEDEDIALALMEVNPAANMVDLRVQFEGSGGSSNKLPDSSGTKDKPTMGRLMCHNPHQSLRRKDSTQVQEEKQSSKTDFSEAANTTDIILTPGANKVTLHAQVANPGNYRLAQVSVGLKNCELLSPRLGCRYRFTVQKDPPSIQVQAGNLVAGIEQQIQVVLHSGSCAFDKEKVLVIRSSLGLKMKQVRGSELSTELSVPLPETKPFTSTCVDLIVKADLVTQKDSSVIEHKLIAKCPWTSEEKKLTLTFVLPFVSSYKLHTVGQRKFVQILLAGNSDNFFKISDHQLSVQSSNAHDVPLVALNPRSQSLVLDSGKSAMYMWEVGVLNIEDEHPLRLEFSVKFKADKMEPEVYKYYVCLQKFKTLYQLSSKVEPHKGTEFCRVGNMSSMCIEISRHSKKSKQSNAQIVLQNSLMYEVRADQHLWAICGRSSGIISFEENDQDTQQVSLDVMPMSAGFLPLPTVHLSKYIPADPKVGGGSSSVPKLEPYSIGQVYNRSKGSQMHVLPPPQSVGSITGLSGGSTSSGSSLPTTAEH